MIPCSRNPHFGKWSFDARSSGFTQTAPSVSCSLAVVGGASELGGIIYSGCWMRAGKDRLGHPHCLGAISVLLERRVVTSKLGRMGRVEGYWS